MRAPSSFFQKHLEFNPISEKTSDRVAALEQVMVALPARVLSAVEADLTEKVENPETGREGMSAAQVLRAALVKQVFGLAYRQLHERIEDSIMIRRFVGYEFRRVPEKSALHANISAIRAETWEEVNDALIRFAKKEKIEQLDQVRIDTTGVESNIHHPSDAALLHDAIRVIARMGKQIKARWSALEFELRDRTRVSKKLAFRISNAATAEARVKPYRDLVRHAKETLGYGRGAVRAMRELPCRSVEEKAVLMRLAEQLKEVCDLLKKVIDQTCRRVFEGESVPADEKVVSIFEPHTYILEKGKRELEFGHKVTLTMGKKLILDADVLDGNPADTENFIDSLQRMKKKYRTVPRTVATDQGFASAENAIEAIELGVEQLSFSGKHIAAHAEGLVVESGPERKLLDRFRAGAEGLISAAKRAGAGLKRCFWKGYDRFCAYVWCTISACNVKEIAGVLAERMAKARKRAQRQAAAT